MLPYNKGKKSNIQDPGKTHRIQSKRLYEQPRPSPVVAKLRSIVETQYHSSSESEDESLKL